MLTLTTQLYGLEGWGHIMWTFFKVVLPFESIVNCHSLFINSFLVYHGDILFGPVVHIRLNAEMSATTNVTLSAEVEGSNNRVKSKGFLLHFFWVLIMWLIKLMTLVIGCLIPLKQPMRTEVSISFTMCAQQQNMFQHEIKLMSDMQKMPTVKISNLH